jgi:tRNA(Ile)-lysidine synthase
MTGLDCSDLLGHVERTIQRRGLFQDGQPILVAVSGGLDSMVLLRVLYELAAGHGWQLRVAHLNHRLRGRSGDADARLVGRVAATLGLPCVIGRSEVREFARAGGLSLEMAARKVRHEFLARKAARLALPTVALAHHADDQLELFFLRLLRGCGGEGLAGMKWRSPSPANPKVALVRPLLDQPKAALRRWAASRKLPFREDASNAQLDIQRNRIRHELLPLLRRHYQPALHRTILRLMDIIGQEAAFAAQEAREWLAHWSSAGGGRRAATSEGLGLGLRLGAGGGSAATPFGELPVAVQRRCVELQLLAQGLEPDYELVEQLRTRPDRAVTVGRTAMAQNQTEGPGPRSEPEDSPLRARRVLSVSRDARGLVRLCQAEPAVFRPGTLEQSLCEKAGEVLFEGLRLRWRITPGGKKPRLGQAGREFFDADRIGPRVVLRHWQPGDRFQPIGLPVPVKLQDLFTNRKVLRRQRHESIVAATTQGELFWVEGLRISERFKLRQRTKRRLQWSWERP